MTYTTTDLTRHRSDDAAPASDGGVERTVRVLVVGAGLSGICMAIKLRQAGERDVLLIDQGQTYGGTWRDNTYPGCACDVPSPAYSFAFAPNPKWTRLFAPQPEIRDYLLSLVEEHDVRSVSEFDTELTNAAWDESRRRWIVTTNRATLVAEILVIATGVFQEPVLPPIAGITSFSGTAFHSARWDHGCDLRGKKVAVVGTGASALQFIPAIQPLVSKLVVCQRTPIWVMPKVDPEFGPALQRLFARYPSILDGMRKMTALAFEGLLASARDATWLGTLEAVARWNMRRTVKDPDLRRRLEPSFRIGCKRVSASNIYYPALNADNTIVAPAATEVRPEAIVTSDGVSHDVDTIIFATGFEVQAAPVLDHLHGRDGRSLAQTWDGAPEAYLTGFANFPNLFMLFSPFSAPSTGGFSQAEIQSDYIVRGITAMKTNGLAVIEVRDDVQRRYTDEMHARLSRSVWERGGCSSFYLDKNGRMTLGYPGKAKELTRRMQRFDLESYQTWPAEQAISVPSTNGTSAPTPPATSR